MEITKKVQLLTKEELTTSQLTRYDFLDLESNNTFSVYSKDKVKAYESLEPYKINEVKFDLLLVKTSKEGNTSISWKVKPFVK